EISKEEYKKITGKDWKKKGNPVISKIEIAKYYIEQAIQSLPSHAEFSVVLLSSSPRFFQNRLVRASSSNKKKALQFLKKARPKLDQNLHGLLKKLMKWKTLDTAYIILDGFPKGGYVDDPKAVREEITMKNLEHAIAMHFRLLLTGASEKDSKISKTARALRNKKIRQYYEDFGKWNFGSLKTLIFPLAKGD
ncbi:MAG: hypothetical protein D6785_09335, partial [Planctomycetota bacterium]